MEEFITAVLALPPAARDIAGCMRQREEDGKWYAFAGCDALEQVVVTPDFDTKAEASRACYTMLKDIQAALREQGARSEAVLIL